MVVNIANSDIYSHVRGLQAVISTNQQGVFGAALPVQALGGYQVSWLGVDVEAIVRTADDRVCDEGIGSLRKTKSGQIKLFARKITPQFSVRQEPFQ